MQKGQVTHEIQHGIATITFSHPASNSLPGALLTDLAKAINDIGIDSRVRVIVLRSAGDGTFCGGASFKELANITTEAEGKKFFGGFAGVINAMRKCHKLIIVCVQGKAVGGALGIIAASDYAIATEEASVKLSELSIGIGPFVIGPAVERKIGLSGFAQLAIDATGSRSAEWAKRHGLYSEVHKGYELMNDSANSLAEKLAHTSPEAMAQLKKVLWHGTENWDVLLSERAAISGSLILSDFSKNALSKVKARLVK